MAVVLEVAADDVQDERLVVHHENGAHRHSLTVCPPWPALRVP
jgi:hypothetical protein